MKQTHFSLCPSVELFVIVNVEINTFDIIKKDTDIRTIVATHTMLKTLY